MAKNESIWYGFTKGFSEYKVIKYNQNQFKFLKLLFDGIFYSLQSLKLMSFKCNA